MPDAPPPEPLPEGEGETRQIELNYEGAFEPEHDRYVIETSAEGVTIVAAIQVDCDTQTLATVLAALPTVISTLIEAADEEIERQHEEREANHG